MHPSCRGGTVVPMHTLHRLHISSRFLFESLCSVAWVGFVLWLTIPWLDDIGGAVTMLGPLRTEDLLEEYRRASVFVLASEQETSPMVIAEAMAASVPVVATRVGGIPHLVDDGRTGLLVAPGDVASLAGAIRGLLADEPRRAEFARRSHLRAQERFRLADVAARVREVYLEAWHANRR